MNTALRFGHPTHSDEALNQSLFRILEDTPLLSMSTVTSDGTAHINTAYFAFDDTLRLFVITDPASAHGRNLALNPSVAITVFDSHQPFWTPLRGLQLFGTCNEATAMELPHGLSCFLKRFPAFGEMVSSPAHFLTKALKVRLHTVDVERVKLFDEPAFGEEVFIDLIILKR